MNIRLRRPGSTGRRLGAATGWGVAGVLALALTAGGAFAATTGNGNSPSPQAAATTKIVGKHGEHGEDALRRWGGRLEHADAVIAGKKGPISIVLQRGVITARSSDSMTVRSADGWLGTWKLTDTTRVRGNGHKSGLADLKVGDRVFVAGPGTGNSGTARIVRDLPTRPVKHPEAEFRGGAIASNPQAEVHSDAIASN